MFKHSPNGKGMIYSPDGIMVPVGIALWRQWNIPPWFTAPVEKAWFYERFF